MFWLIPFAVLVSGILLAAIIAMRDMNVGSAIAAAMVFYACAAAAIGLSVARILGYFM